MLSHYISVVYRYYVLLYPNSVTNGRELFPCQASSAAGERLIDLMDGEELINKLDEYGIGLNEVKSYEIDEDFFNSLSEN